MVFKSRILPSARLFLILALLGSMIGVIPPDRAQAASLLVTNTNDSGAGSLRDAILNAVPGDIITFDPSLAGQTIALSSNLVINKNLTVDGSGLSPQLTISGGSAFHLEFINSAAVMISDLTISDGYTSGNGGAIVSNGNLTLINTTLRNNFAEGFGGAIYTSSLTLKNTTIYQNRAYGSGGAIAISGGSKNIIVNSTITQNRAGNMGGALILQGVPYVEVFHSTLAGNHASAGTEVALTGVGGSLILSNTILVCTPGTAGCIVQTGNFSLDSTTSVIGIGSFSDFGLSELGDHGGQTQTMALLTGSSLIDAGDDAICANSLVNGLDQRGAVRPWGSHCDIGAYEFVEYTISGNTQIGGVTLDYSGGTTTSDASGNYSITIPYDWSGSVTPQKAGYRFTPESRNYENVQSDQLNQDFAAERVYTISGNAGVASAILSYEDNGIPKMVTALNNGDYSLLVPEGWTGTVTPSKANVTFIPASRSYTGVQADQADENYTAVITVVNSNNTGSGSLRQAVMDAVAGAMIHFDTALAGQTIPLSSQITIDKNLTIAGSGLSPRVEISGNDVSRIFYVNRDLTVTLRSLVLKRGKTTGTSYTSYGGAVFVASSTQLTVDHVAFVENMAHQAGALYASGFAKVSISESEFLSNSAEMLGGAIYLPTPLNLTAVKTRFANNSAASGGAVFLDASGGAVFEENVFENNTASSGGGAIASQNVPGVGLTIKRNLFSGNSAGMGGGAISISRFSSTFVVLENNTFYGNQAGNLGGALASGTQVELYNNTFSHNQAVNGGASVSLTGTAALHKLYNNIFANSTGGVECLPLTASSAVTGSNNLVEDGAGSCSSLPNTIISEPMLSPLGDNGGSTHTMPLLPESPAIDNGTSLNCPATDQRGVARPQESGCDIGAFEYLPLPTPTPTNTSTPTATPPPSSLYLSFTGGQTIGGVASSDEDILRFDGQNWSLFFDGSDVGVGSPDLVAFSIVDSDTILMSFSANVTVNSISVTPRDIVRFDATSLGSVTAGAFSMYLNGIDVGLDVSNENIDGIDLLPDGRVLISTTGTPSVPPNTEVRDEDILAFTPTALGNNTSGSWARYLDGSSVGLADSSDEDIDALDVGPNGGIYLSTIGNFAVPGLSGADEDVFICKFPTESSCSYPSALYFDGSTWGLGANDIDGLDLFAAGPIPTAVPTNTPTRTPTPTFTSSPTPTSGSGNALTFTAVADARVVQMSPTTNYGTATTLQADGDSGAAQTSFIRFTAAGISGSIQSAKLRVFCTTNGTANGPAVYLANNTWTESGTGGITWNTQPALLSGAFDNKGTIAANSWVEYDVTALVTGNGTYTFALVADSSDGIVFSSREGTTPPQLVVTLGEGAPTATHTPTATFTSIPGTTNSPTRTPTPTHTPTATSSLNPSPTNTAAASTITFTSLSDAYVDASNPANNYGASTTLRVDASPVVRSYLRFNVQGLNGTVTRAILRIYANSASSLGCTANSVSDDTWSEPTINYNNAPAVGGTLGSSGSFGADVWISIDVTAYINGNGTYNLALTTPSSTAVSLASREARANAPQLIIETTP